MLSTADLIKVEYFAPRGAVDRAAFDVKSIADAVKASCSAYPFFDRTIVRTSMGEDIELIDGGYCANNPTLYAIADAVQALKRERKDIRLVSVGVGIYPDPKPGLKMWLAKKFLVSVQLLQKTLEINTQSMDQLRQKPTYSVPVINCALPSSVSLRQIYS